jgi:hypothetical protein
MAASAVLAPSSPGSCTQSNLTPRHREFCSPLLSLYALTSFAGHWQI